eukprot:3157149-Rhodomonas_salina.4
MSGTALGYGATRRSVRSWVRSYNCAVLSWVELYQEVLLERKAPYALRAVPVLSLVRPYKGFSTMLGTAVQMCSTKLGRVVPGGFCSNASSFDEISCLCTVRGWGGDVETGDRGRREEGKGEREERAREEGGRRGRRGRGGVG